MTIHKAKNLVKSDMFGKSDPYVILNVGKENFRTSTINNNLNPEWNYDMKFETNNETPDELTLEVFDNDVGRRDDALGMATLNLREIVNNKKLVNKWIPLEKCKSGEVLYSAEFVPSEKHHSSP